MSYRVTLFGLLLSSACTLSSCASTPQRPSWKVNEDDLRAKVEAALAAYTPGSKEAARAVLTSATDYSNQLLWNKSTDPVTLPRAYQVASDVLASKLGCEDKRLAMKLPAAAEEPTLTFRAIAAAPDCVDATFLHEHVKRFRRWGHCADVVKLAATAWPSATSGADQVHVLDATDLCSDPANRPANFAFVSPETLMRYDLYRLDRAHQKFQEEVSEARQKISRSCADDCLTLYSETGPCMTSCRGHGQACVERCRASGEACHRSCR